MKHGRSTRLTLSPITTAALLVTASLLHAGCATGAGGGMPSAGGLSREEAVGTWSLTDSDNELFNVIVAPDGSAVDTYWKGPDGAKGERGRWELVNGCLDIRYSSGWRDLISRRTLGYRKLGYPPGLAKGSGPQDQPANDGGAVKVTGDRLPFVGIWTVPSGGETTQYEVTLALRSDGMAMKTCDPFDSGTWRVSDGVATIVWADGWRSTLERADSEEWFYRVWRPGMPPTDMPTASGKVRKVVR
jgi:hypothetical protein